jgi:hemerythrin
MALKWDEKRMTTGQPIIDAQHKEWIMRFNEFDDAIISGRGNEIIIKTLEFLKQYTNTHFATEEEAMARLHTPVQDKNLRAHQEFREKLAELTNWVGKIGVSTVEILSLKMDLEDWVENHICTVDVQLRYNGGNQ